ncbi:MAG: hypothetical protein SGJ19_19915 [Planctomycetia bacterium]|nr:hypothetical protein [Planctomycetia bacterium]
MTNQLIVNRETLTETPSGKLGIAALNGTRFESRNIRQYGYRPPRVRTSKLYAAVGLARHENLRNPLDALESAWNNKRLVQVRMSLRSLTDQIH